MIVFCVCFFYFIIPCCHCYSFLLPFSLSFHLLLSSPSQSFSLLKSLFLSFPFLFSLSPSFSLLPSPSLSFFPLFLSSPIFSFPLLPSHSPFPLIPPSLSFPLLPFLSLSLSFRPFCPLSQSSSFIHSLTLVFTTLGVHENVASLLFKSLSKRGESFSAAETHLEIGCIKSTTTPAKKSCDFLFENPKEANDKGFSFDPIKGSVELGHKKDIVCRWQPPADHDPSTAVNSCTVITIKAEVTIQYRILLQGLIVSEEQLRLV